MKKQPTANLGGRNFMPAVGGDAALAGARDRAYRFCHYLDRKQDSIQIRDLTKRSHADEDADDDGRKV